MAKGGGGNVFKQAGNIVTGGAFGGAQKLGSGGSFRMTRDAQLGEQQAIRALRDQAAGNAPSISAQQYQMALNQAAQAQQQAAASARGVNPALAFRAAADATAMAQADAAAQSAMMQEEERRMAQQALIQAANAQRGVALGGAQANLASQGQYRGQTFDFLGNLGGSAAKAAGGGGG